MDVTEDEPEQEQDDYDDGEFQCIAFIFIYNEVLEFNGYLYRSLFSLSFIGQLPTLPYHTAPIIDEAEKEAENELQQALERARRAKLKQSVKLTCMYGILSFIIQQTFVISTKQ